MPDLTQDFDISHEDPKKSTLTPRREEAARTNFANALGSVSAFCEQIKKDAQEEVQRILGRAELSARRKGEEAEKEASQTARQTRQTVEAQAKSIETRAMAGVSLEMRKTLLRVQGEVIEEVFAKVREKLKEVRRTQQYADSLKKLSVEGITALGEVKCVLAPGVEDRQFFTPKFLRELEELVSRAGGRKVEVTISDDILPDDGGVRVYSGKRTVLFDNTLEARMERLADELRTIVAREVFAEERKKDQRGVKGKNV